MSGPNPKHGQALETDIDNDEALIASGPLPKHGGAAALSVGAAGATPALDAAAEPDSGSQEVSV
jgi:hypothetical protein